MTLDLTDDRFLGGRLIIAQPKKGFRAGHDSVLLAAAIPAKGAERVAELGSGAGVASLCLAVRMPGVILRGVEIDADLVRLANGNAARNGMMERVRFVAGDALAFKAAAPFDHVFFNPPFHPDTGRQSPDAARDRAMREEGSLITAWVAHALGLIAPHGTVTLILRADGMARLYATLSAQAVSCRPLLPQEGKAAKRAIVHIRPGQPFFTELAPLILHREDGKPTDEADALLRHAKALNWTAP